MIEAAELNRRVNALPALPKALMDTLAALRSEAVSAEECADHMPRDPAISARVLRLANSAFYGVPGRVASPRDAISLLGRRSLLSLLTTAAVTAQFGAVACPGFGFAAFWRHALAAALAAQSIAREQRGDEDLAFTAGLLHDIGRLALATHYPAELAEVLARAREQDRPRDECERELLGLDHAQVGALIAAHWHFPPSVCGAITGHHGPPVADGPAGAVDIVHLADAVAHALDLEHADDEAVPPPHPVAWQRLGLAPPAVLRIFERTESGVQALCEALSL